MSTVFETLVVEHAARTGAGRLDWTEFDVELTRARAGRELEISCTLTRLGGSLDAPEAASREFAITLSGRDELAGLADALSKALLACTTESASEAA